MKLSIKLPLAFAAALALLLAGALFGVYQLNRVVATYEGDVLLHVAAHKKGAEVAVEFALAIQEWKNVLLRGKDPKELDKYWASHTKALDAVNVKLDELAQLLAKEDEAPVVAKLKTEMAGARDGYAKALEQYKAANMDFEAGDKAAKGKDRAAATLLKELQERLSKAESASSEEAEALAQSATRISIAVMVLVTAVALVGSVLLSRSIVAELAKAVGIAGTVARGDLTHPIEVSGDKEVADLLQSLKDMQAHLITLVSHVRQGAEGVATASREIAMGNHDLSMRTEQQASALQQTASSMEELSTTVGHSADNARQASQLATGASSVATRGGEVMGQVVETMRGINEASRKIADIISVIDGIAFQTNILALNAAVEAARAGEQGRGFAVVASEVRALAGRSAEAAKEIKSLIGASVERVEHGSALVDQAGNTMTEVVSAIRRVTDIVGEISAASSEQNAGVSEVRDAVQRIDTATQQNAALVEEMAAAASGLQGQADELVREVATFKLNAQDEGGGFQRAQVRVSAPAAKPFQGEERRTVPAAPKAAAAKPKASAPASPPKVLAAAPKPAAAAPKKAAAPADDEWETF